MTSPLYTTILHCRFLRDASSVSARTSAANATHFELPAEQPLDLEAEELHFSRLGLDVHAFADYRQYHALIKLHGSSTQQRQQEIFSADSSLAAVAECMFPEGGVEMVQSATGAVEQIAALAGSNTGRGKAQRLGGELLQILRVWSATCSAALATYAARLDIHQAVLTPEVVQEAQAALTPERVRHEAQVRYA